MADNDVITRTRIPCPNCRGRGWVHLPGHPDEPCFVCDEDGTLEW